MKNFVTLSTSECPAVDLYKDPGMIPYCMTQLGYQAKYVSFLEQEAISQEVREAFQPLQIDTIKNDVCGRRSMLWRSKSVFKYLWKNAKQIDVLNLYYLKYSILYGALYKMRNPHGILYVKLDMDADAMIQRESDKINGIRNLVYKLYLRHIVDIVSVESQKDTNYCQTRYGIRSPKLQYIPNGIDDYFTQKNHIALKPFDEKENLFITVARIGTPQKNNELMLEALEKIGDLNGWKFLFIGNIEESFQVKIASFYERNPQLKESVHFLGVCTDRKKLFEFYNCAKVFCLTSRYESFGIVNVEAQWFGDYIITTPISSASDFIEDNENLGTMVHSANELAEEMKRIVRGEKDLSAGYQERVEHGKWFAWSRICRQLDTCLKEAMKS